MNRQESLKTISSFKDLEKNWDGYNGHPPTSKCISNSSIIVDLMMVEVNDIYDIYPNPNGTISIEYYVNEGLVVIEIGNTSFNVYKRGWNTDDYYREDLPCNLYGIDELEKFTIR